MAPTASPLVQLQLLGPPRVSRGGGDTARLEGRGAALVALVALDGPLPRERAARLLWPDAPDRTARANLRQALRRIREAVGPELLAADDPLALGPAVAVDVAALRRLAAAPSREEAVPEGILLDGVLLDGAPEAAEWLDRARLDLERTRVDATVALAGALEQAGDHEGAAAEAARALALDPLSEPAHRQLIRARFFAGDRAGALAAFERCRAALEEVLGVAPSPETVRLADEVVRGRRVPSHRATPTLPLSVQRPPILAGREREWGLMEEAWSEGKGIVLGGPPGIGKTRLMQDFLSTHASTHGGAAWVWGRPGDRLVPYSSQARLLDETLVFLGEAAAGLPRWVHLELARIVPRLGPAPGPLRSEEDKLRLWQANVEVFRATCAAGRDALGFDDLQYVDPASGAIGAYTMNVLQEDARAPLRTISCFRTGELHPAALQLIRDMAAGGRILLLELEPLQESAAVELIRTLEVPGLDAVSAELARYAGGNPLLLVETVRHLVESQAVGQGVPDRIPPRVETLLEARLGRLAPGALQLARVLAILGTTFTLERAARILETSVAQLMPDWQGLEAAQLVRGEAFAHDLEAEAVVANTPAPLAAALHARAAEVLAQTGGAPGLIASHWQAAGDPARAEASLRTAEKAASWALLPAEAAEFFRGE